jgi:hypothetical protein
MTSPELFSHPYEPEAQYEHASTESQSEPVEFPVFSHADKPSSAPKQTPS